MSDKEIFIWLGEKLISTVELIEIISTDNTRKYYMKINNLRIEITKERYQELKYLKEA